jgi:hypothetical protein
LCDSLASLQHRDTTWTLAWLTIIEYGDFYDLPHQIVVERQGVLYALDCPFDDDADDYSSHYAVFRLPDTARKLAAQWFSPWDAVLRLGERVGRIPVGSVQFDATDRYAMHEDALKHL